nr:Lar family restriction alleviation protein [Caproiciproducens faecalis]
MKSCPFCGGEAEEKHSSTSGLFSNPIAYYFVQCKSCGATGEADLIPRKADEAWNRRPAPENKPLTLEELRKMDGEPAYCVNSRGDGKWAIVHICDDIQDSFCGDGNSEEWEFAYYGLTDDSNQLLDGAWLAYARKPEQEEFKLNRLKERLERETP